MIVGEPTPKMEKYFRVMVESQDAAIEALGPGVKCSEVDRRRGKLSGTWVTRPS